MTLLLMTLVANTASADIGMCLLHGQRFLPALAATGGETGGASRVALSGLDDVGVSNLDDSGRVTELRALRVAATSMDAASPDAGETQWCVASDTPECSGGDSGTPSDLLCARGAAALFQSSAPISPKATRLGLPRTPYKGAACDGVDSRLCRPPG